MVRDGTGVVVVLFLDADTVASAASVALAVSWIAAAAPVGFVAVAFAVAGGTAQLPAASLGLAEVQGFFAKLQQAVEVEQSANGAGGPFLDPLMAFCFPVALLALPSFAVGIS